MLSQPALRPATTACRRKVRVKGAKRLADTPG